ncbi:hypothetical protein Sjap_009807 [Stephania japonica]|uniref:Amino acid transporter transmembrane domain-containing protein n=1 Tax=Stephania japonica TaxID=461633 RepID=A0AAP0J988_9MAGN
MDTHQTALKSNHLLLSMRDHIHDQLASSKTPKSFTLRQLFASIPRTPRTTPQVTPLHSVFVSKPDCPENQVGKNYTTAPNFHSQIEDWLPITESRKGNVCYAAFHTINSGMGFQSLVLPLSFTTLGWSWGIVCLCIAFMWQLYTTWLLIQMHEAVPGRRYSRYLQLAKVAFGEKAGKLLTLFPLGYLSGGACVCMAIMAGSTMKLLVHIMSGPKQQSLTTIEWSLVFLCFAILIAQLPNLNSIAWISILGAITTTTYLTLIWAISVTKNRPVTISHEPIEENSSVERVFSTLNAIGVIAFAFRGHNLVLEIQGTLPSNEKCPSRETMWRGVKFAYVVIGMCLLPLTICGYWAYGNQASKQMNADGTMLSTLLCVHGRDTSRLLLGFTALFVVVSYVCGFQIYAMPVFDNLEFAYTTRKNKPCPWWVRSGFRALFGCLVFLIAVAIPFLPSLSGLIGGIALPVTLAYPCFMWNVVKKPERPTIMWYLNWVLGVLGMILSLLVVSGGIWGIVVKGLDVRFFKP